MTSFIFPKSMLFLAVSKIPSALAIVISSALAKIPDQITVSSMP